VNVVGIDPGQKGGIAFLSDYHAEAVPMPMVGKDLDVRAIVEIIRTKSVELVVLEKVHAMPHQGVSSTFTFGYGVGVIVGAVETLGLPLRWVTPQAWKKVVLAGTGKDKDAAIAHVRQAYPGIELMPGRSRTPHDGIADAVCIAEWARRTL
jgi:crossover junction endodeoxyribonuclease RuvC